MLVIGTSALDFHNAVDWTVCVFYLLQHVLRSDVEGYLGANVPSTARLEEPLLRYVVVALMRNTDWLLMWDDVRLVLAVEELRRVLPDHG